MSSLEQDIASAARHVETRATLNGADALLLKNELEHRGKELDAHMSDILDQLVGEGRDEFTLATKVVAAAANDPAALAKYIADLVDVNPREHTSTTLKSGFGALVGLQAARTQMQQAQDLMGEAARLLTSLAVKVATAGLA